MLRKDGRMYGELTSLAKLRALVIDDDDIAREMLCDALRDAGCDVTDLPSAIGATRAIYEKGIQIVVLDVIMPSINGDKLARVLRQAAKGKQLTIILVSSRPMAELERLAMAAQADAVVSKAAVRRDLARAVEKAHRKRMQSPSVPPRSKSV